MDASVMHGAGCNSDHRLLRAKIIVGKKIYIYIYIYRVGVT